MSMSEILPSIKSWQILPILSEAAQWELEGPRMTGPITSLKILGKLMDKWVERQIKVHDIPEYQLGFWEKNYSKGMKGSVFSGVAG